MCEGRGKENIYPGAVPADSIEVLLFCFQTLMTSFSVPKPILSKPLAEINHSIKTALLMFDVKKLTLRIVWGRSKRDDL